MAMLFRYITRNTVLFINLIFVVLQILALQAPYIAPSSFVWLQFIALIFPIIATIQCFFVVFWLCCRTKRNALFSLITILLSLGAYGRAFGHLHFKTESKEESISLLSYNVSIFTDKNKYKEIKDFLFEQDPDIICMQEFGFYKNSAISQNVILRDFSQKYPYRHLWYKNQNSNLWWGLATFSKYPIVKKEKIVYDSRYNVSIYSDVKIGDDTIRIINNHLESNKFSLSDMNEYDNLANNISKDKLSKISHKLSNKMRTAFLVREKQAEIVAQTIKETTYPLIVCGDFNDVPQSYTYSKISKNLTDMLLEGNLGYNYTYYKHGMFVRIDNILCSGEILPVNSAILSKDYSDHKPVTAQFKIKRNK